MNDDGAYQSRLALFARLMFWSFVVLRVGEVVLYMYSPRPESYGTIVIVGVCSLLLLASMRWLVLVRRPLSAHVLVFCDLLMMAGCGAVFGATAILAWNRSESAYACLIYAAFMVMMRTIVVPSTARQTAAISAVALLPLIIAAGYLARNTTQDVPGPAFFAGAVMYCVVALAIASAGSHIIYDLRSEVRALVQEGVELGQYKLIRRVGAGGVGEVFVARHALLRRQTAIKLVEPALGTEHIAHCERAVQQMSQLRHHNSVAIYDYGRSPDGVFYFAMEYLEGVTLRALLERSGPQPIARVLAILHQVCLSLHEAHQLGLAHGNLIPANVMLCDRGGVADTVKVTDFGFGRAVASSERDLVAVADLARDLLGGHLVPSLAECFDGSTTARELAQRLRALAPTWSQAHAREGWSEYRRTSDPFMPVPATLAIDFANRGT